MQFKTKLGLVDIPNTEVLRAAREIEDHDCPHFVIVGYNDNRTPCAAITVYAASAGLDVVRANAVGMLHDAGFPQVKTADAMSWPNGADQPRAESAAKPTGQSHEY
jgi:hypothetical protein